MLIDGICGVLIVCIRRVEDHEFTINRCFCCLAVDERDQKEEQQQPHRIVAQGVACSFVVDRVGGHSLIDGPSGGGSGLGINWIGRIGWFPVFCLNLSAETTTDKNGMSCWREGKSTNDLVISWINRKAATQRV